MSDIDFEQATVLDLFYVDTPGLAKCSQLLKFAALVQMQSPLGM